MADLTDLADFISAPLQGAVNAAGDATSAVANMLPGYQAKMQALGNQAASTGYNAGQATAGANQVAAGQIAAATADAEAATQKQKDDAYAASLRGLTPGANSAAVLSMIGEVTDSTMASIAQSHKIQNLQSTSFWDDPLTWLTNQVAIPFEQDTLSTIQNRQQVAAKGLQDLSTSFDAQARVDNLVDVADATKKLGGITDQALGMAKEKAAQAQLESARLGLQAISINAETTKAGFAAAMDMSRLRDTAVAQQIQLSELPYREAARQESIERQKVMVEQRLQTQEGQQAQLEDYNKALVQLGAAPVASVKALAALPQAAKNVLNNALLDPEFITGRSGATPAQARNNLNAAAPIFPLTPGVRATLNDLNTIAATAQDLWDKDPSHPRFFQLKQAEQDAIVNQAILTKTANERASVPTQGSMFSPASLLNTLKMAPQIDDPAVQKITSILSVAAKASPNLPTDPALFGALGVQMITSGQMTAEQFSSAAAKIFQAQNVNLNTVKQLSRFAIAGPTTDEFKMTLPGPGGRPILVNVANPAAWNSYITRMLAINSDPYGGVGMDNFIASMGAGDYNRPLASQTNLLRQSGAIK